MVKPKFCHALCKVLESPGVNRQGGLLRNCTQPPTRHRTARAERNREGRPGKRALWRRSEHVHLASCDSRRPLQLHHVPSEIVVVHTVQHRVTDPARHVRPSKDCEDQNSVEDMFHVLLVGRRGHVLSERERATAHVEQQSDAIPWSLMCVRRKSLTCR